MLSCTGRLASVQHLFPEALPLLPSRAASERRTRLRHIEKRRTEIFPSAFSGKRWWTRQASNLRQSGYEPGALPTELRVQQRKICLHSRRLASEKMTPFFPIRGNLPGAVRLRSARVPQGLRSLSLRLRRAAIRARPEKQLPPRSLTDSLPLLHSPSLPCRGSVPPPRAFFRTAPLFRQSRPIK